MNIQTQRIDTNGITLDVHQAGSDTGELLIFLHGFPEHGLAWQKQMLYFAGQGYRVWAPDQRGYGQSDKPRGIRAYQLDVLAQDIIGLIDAAGVEKAYVMGHDWGGTVAWWLGCNYPERLHKLAILNVPHHTTLLKALKTDKRQRRRSWYMFVFLLPWLPVALLRRKNYQLMRRALYGSANADTFSEQDMAQYLRNWSQPGALKGMISWYRAALLLPARARLKKVPVPTQIIWGRKDKFLLAELAEASLPYCEQGQVVYLDEVGHWLVHEQGQQVSELLLDFIQG